jgi:propionyl-CoA carboxylase alpha chain
VFAKILIANRGEIACRIIRTCRRLGIETVAVCSEADLDSLHARMADEKVVIGPAAASESYLAIDRILEACRATGAEAVHPGYGFLSERAAFAQALADAGITFIGPPVGAIQAMGDKIESKRLAREAHVSTVPGGLEAITDPDEAHRIARKIGYPVIVKASAGGGGKGMRIVRSAAELGSGIERARSEAKSSFGDERVFIERFVDEPRHIEIQVLGDQHGHVIHLGERECSIQRRHQKVIEEAPSPFLDEATRRAMGEQAVSLAQAVGYYSAGTVEFIVDQERNFYFLEMNTRLQVEHPVTEAVYGLDLVELMIRIAAGERLEIAQADLSSHGWAIEARLYAEDPSRGFLPSTGRIVRYREPAGSNLRIDSGVVEGSEVSLFYDPMLAKVVAHAADRAHAIDRLREALDLFVLRGPASNLAFLSSVLAHPRFREGDLSTNFIAEEYGERFTGEGLERRRLNDIAAILVALRLRESRRAASVSGTLPGYHWRPEPNWRVELGDIQVDVEVELREGIAVFHCDGGDRQITLSHAFGDLVVRAAVNGTAICFQADPVPEGFLVRDGGVELHALIRTRRAAEFAARMPPKERADTSRLVRSPMPGLILRLSVESGEEVKAGQELLVLEAMKMENVLRAERDGTIAETRIVPGDAVAADQVLLTFA